MLGVKGEFYLYAYYLVLNVIIVLVQSAVVMNIRTLDKFLIKMHNVRDTLDTTYSKESLL